MTTKPRLLPGEPSLGYRPVAVDMTCRELLARESRINYAKLQTIEHNVRVIFIGAISNAEFEYVRRAADDCWEKRQASNSRSPDRRRS
jgi:hypothetical protein